MLREGVPEDIPPPWPSSTAPWKGEEQVLLWVEPPLPLFPSFHRLICSEVEHLKVNTFAPLSTKAVAHNHFVHKHV